jgi:hypothetical protein
MCAVSRHYACHRVHSSVSRRNLQSYRGHGLHAWRRAVALLMVCAFVCCCVMLQVDQAALRVTLDVIGLVSSRTLHFAGRSSITQPMQQKHSTYTCQHYKDKRRTSGN